MIRSFIVLWLACVLATASAVAQQIPDQPLGLGVVQPRFHDLENLYFYGAPGFDQPTDSSSPVDSVTFVRTVHQVDIETAPPWLAPEVIKLDYDLLYFRLVTVSRNWVETIVNRFDGRTAWVDRHAVNVIYWADFLPNVFSVEVHDPNSNPVLLKPLAEASVVAPSQGTLRPVAINGAWMLVAFNEMDQAPIPAGWVRWHDGEKLLILYYLLS